MRRLGELPADVQELVLRHWSAMRIQRSTRRWMWYRHTRRIEVWRRLCAVLPIGIRRELVCYSHVRREWMSDPSGWFDIGEDDIRAIIMEARNGMWGSKVFL